MAARTLSRGVVVLSLAALLFVVGTVRAEAQVNLTGTWEGTANCTGFFNGVKTQDKFVGQLLISQSGTDLNLSFLGTDYNGEVIQDSKSAKKAEGPFIACSTDPEPIQDYSEIGHMKVTVDTAKDKATFKATSVFAVVGPVVATCKWTFKRLDDVDPVVSDCLPE